MSTSKRVAQHFISRALGRATPAIWSRTIKQAQVLLDSGYSSEEIHSVLDYLLEEEKREIYSLGYLSTSIESTLKKIRDLKKENDKKLFKTEVREKEKSIQVAERPEVNNNNEKLQKFGIQSRLREKYFGDMFEE